MQFAFRWMNCLLMREISMKCTVRMWDTYLVSLVLLAPLTLQAEGTDAFSQFHLYVCSALLVKFSERLRDMDFQVGSRTSIKTPANPLGNDHVPSMPADADMDRSRYRALALRVVCTQDSLARGREPLCQPKAERGRFRYARSMTPALCMHASSDAITRFRDGQVRSLWLHPS